VKGKTERFLTALFAVMIVVNLGYLVMGFLSIPVYYQRVTSLTIPEIVSMPGSNYPTNEMVKESAAAQGLTLSQYALVQIVFHCALVLLFTVVAVVIVLKAGRNWFAWYSAFFLIFIAEYAFFHEVYIANLLPWWIYDAGAMFWPLILPYLFLFPNGRPAPRLGLWVVGPVFALHTFFQTVGYLLLLFPNNLNQTDFEFFLDPFQAMVVGTFLFILGCQVYRYLRISTREEMQQTKWFLMGFALALALDTISQALGEANPFHSEISLAIFAFVPLGLTVAILRYRLWDIDVVIRRTLQYSILTGLLTLVYLGGVTVLQAALPAVGGQSPAIVIVVTTLAIAALFNPLRRRIQDFIDRRFYRQKYDAEKALAEFASTTRSETNLGQLSWQLVDTVQRILKPESSTLWLTKRKK
jgi:hypothetical protein